MPRFFQNELAAFAGEKNNFQNVDFRKGTFENSDAAEQGTLLEIIPVHVKNPPVIQFIAYIANISDNFKSQYSSEQPFGRTDPFYVWKSSKRTIGLSWEVPSSSISLGLHNLNNLSWFLASLYPTYKDTTTATSIAASPMFRVRHANLISSPTNDGQGILCIIDGAKVDHDRSAGFIHVKPRNMGTSFANDAAKVLQSAGFENNMTEGKTLLIPKLIKISCTLNVVHDHSLGWDYSTGQWRGGWGAPNFPYDFGLVRAAQSPGAADLNLLQDSTDPGTVGAPGSITEQEQAAAESDIFSDKGSTPGASTLGEGSQSN